jgi:integrase
VSRRTFGRVLRTRSGQYAIRYRVNGVEVQRTIGPKLKDASDTLKDIASKYAREEFLGIKSVAAATLAEAWAQVSPLFRARLTPAGLKNAEGMVNILREFFGETPLTEIGAAEIRGFLAHVRNVRKATAATANRYASFCARFFTEASSRGLARGNPVAGVKRAREELRPVPFIAAEDVRRIESRTPDAFRAFVALAGETGARRGELAALTWQDVHLARRRIVIRRSKSKRPRECPLTAHAVATVEGLLAARAAIPMAGEDLVFAGLAAAVLSKQFPGWAKAAGFPGLRFHDLRHGWASRLAAAGVPVTDIQRLGGWGSLVMVQRYAAHCPANFADRALAALERAEAGEPEAPKAAPPKAGSIAVPA